MYCTHYGAGMRVTCDIRLGVTCWEILCGQYIKKSRRYQFVLTADTEGIFPYISWQETTTLPVIC